MKNKKYILIFVFVLLAIIYIIRAFAGGRIVKETLYSNTVEDSITVKALVIKNETLYSAQSKGTPQTKFSSGDRVAVGSEIAVIYTGTIDAELKNNLEQVNRKIEILQSNKTENNSFSNDISKLEQEISSNLDAIIESSYKKDMYSITSLKYNISALAEHKFAVEGNTPAKNSTLETLKQTKAKLEEQIGAAQSSIYTNTSGLFSSYIDGLEELITPNNMTELTPSKFDELCNFDEKNVKSSKNKKDNYVCKVIDNYTYYIAFNIDEKKLYGLDVGDSAGLRFYDISPSVSNAVVTYISPVENGQATIILECRDYQEGLLENRFVNIDFVKSRYSGYKVSLDALRTKGNENGLYVNREGILTFVPVSILYNKDDFLIVESADENNPLKLYDEVIIHASSYKEGQMIQ